MHDDELDRRAAVGGEIVRRAGGLARAFHARRTEIAVRDKGGTDFVTAADLAVQDQLYRALEAAFPHDARFGEEGGEPAIDPERPTWVIDPIDGTSNFAHGRPGWCVSVAWHAGGRSLLGWVYDPLADELFHARRGRGAWLGERRLHCRRHATVAGAQLVFGLTRRAPATATLAAVERLTRDGASVRAYGVGALSIAYVGAGRCDAFFEAAISTWDVAAALLIAEEAGALANPAATAAADRAPFAVLAATPALYPRLAAELAFVDAAGPEPAAHGLA